MVYQHHGQLLGILQRSKPTRLTEVVDARFTKTKTYVNSHQEDVSSKDQTRVKNIVMNGRGDVVVHASAFVCRLRGLAASGELTKRYNGRDQLKAQHMHPTQQKCRFKAS
jgi:hypothetical protein